jgi:hypothetical protein
MNSPIEIRTDVQGFGRMIDDYAAAAMIDIEDAYRMTGRLICGDLMTHTPPFSGKTIRKMVAARENAQMRDSEIENQSALAIGKRRVEKDVRKVIYGLTGATISARHAKVLRGSNPNATEWGTLQKCQGKQAVRVFATKSGEVYGADLSQWLPHASMDDLRKHHDENRNARGRVTTAGQKTRNVGRWRWLNVIVTTEALVKKYLARAWDAVGEARGGWAEGFIQLGGRLSRRGWVGKHAATAGHYSGSFQPGNIKIRIENRSHWASAGDPDRIITAVMAGRAQALQTLTKGTLEKRWHS